MADKFEYHTFLHHSQTTSEVIIRSFLFEYHTFLHHSQTQIHAFLLNSQFEYHTFLHHSQTSNSKMKCYHLHKTLYSNSLIRKSHIYHYL